MAKRKYTHIKIIEPKLIAMRAAGKTNREIAEFFGLEIRQIENWVNRYHREAGSPCSGTSSKTSRTSQKTSSTNQHPRVSV